MAKNRSGLISRWCEMDDKRETDDLKYFSLTRERREEGGRERGRNLRARTPATIPSPSPPLPSTQQCISWGKVLGRRESTGRLSAIKRHSRKGESLAKYGIPIKWKTEFMRSESFTPNKYPPQMVPEFILIQVQFLGGHDWMTLPQSRVRFTLHFWHHFKSTA